MFYQSLICGTRIDGWICRWFPCSTHKATLLATTKMIATLEGATMLIFITSFFEFGFSRSIFVLHIHVNEIGRGSSGSGENGAGKGLQNQQPPTSPFFMIGEARGWRETQLQPLPPPIKAVPPLATPLRRSNYSPFRTSIAVVVGALTTIFCLTFLLLLYAKHCKRGTGVIGGYLGDSAAGDGGGLTPVSARRNSGMDRTVVESLPVFRFGSLTGQKDGLECAVCLNRFVTAEVLRLLPKCKHAFHVECVDTWLDAHSTCPLCRYRVDPEDVLLVQGNQSDISPPPDDNISNESTRRVSGRHSYSGDRGGGRPSASASEVHIRRSYDESQLRTKRESVAVGYFDRYHSRKDGLLMTVDRTSEDRRLDHRIIISEQGRERWSDIHPSDLLYLRSEMLMNESRRSASSMHGQAARN